MADLWDQQQSEQQQQQPACPLQASPHQAIFTGPFHSNRTYTETSLKNVSEFSLVINIKMSEPEYIKSSPKCFFLEPGKTIGVDFTHKPFVVTIGETYYRHQIGFFYMQVPGDWTGEDAHNFKTVANEMGWQWELCRMRVTFNFTDEDYAAAEEAAAAYEQQATGTSAAATDADGLPV